MTRALQVSTGRQLAELEARARQTRTELFEDLDRWQTAVEQKAEAAQEVVNRVSSFPRRKAWWLVAAATAGGAYLGVSTRRKSAPTRYAPAPARRAAVWGPLFGSLVSVAARAATTAYLNPPPRD